MSEFIRAMAVADLAPGKSVEISLGGRAVALFNIEGRYYAISNTCLHRGGPLGQGYIEGATVTCPWHAWTFDVTTGANVVNPDLKVACYETKVDDGQVFVRIVQGERT
jgi:3-phenylpropionate/trans-cinnamate dioxygenase ferredoxin component